jgi:hypothetical protein
MNVAVERVGQQCGIFISAFLRVTNYNAAKCNLRSANEKGHVPLNEESALSGFQNTPPYQSVDFTGLP